MSYEARYPKRCNGPIKIGNVHFNSIKLMVLTVVFGLYINQINIGFGCAILAGMFVEKLYKQFGRGVLKHMLWRYGFWAVKSKLPFFSPGTRRLMR